MLRIKFGERAPVVATLQCLLNQVVGAALVVDGIYGRNTRRAVQDFQSHAHLPTSGEVEGKFWRHLMDETGYRTVDVVDAGDPGLMGAWRALRALGGEPIELYPMCNGVSDAARRIRDAVGSGPESIVLLRFDGHGSSGRQYVSAGLREGGSHGASISNMPIWVLWNEPDSAEHAIDTALRSIKPLMVPFGSVQFHGCRVGVGENGRDFLANMGEIFGVPASGAYKQQYENAYEFEGPVRHVYPNRGTLQTWSRKIRGFGEMSFAQ